MPHGVLAMSHDVEGMVETSTKPAAVGTEAKILATCRRVYKNLTGNEIEVKAVHAGLECGIIGELYHGMDMISFGPLLENVHSPQWPLQYGFIDILRR